MRGTVAYLFFRGRALYALSALCFLLLSACQRSSGDAPASPIQWNYFFETGAEGWVPGYSDYPANLSRSDSLDLYGMLYGFTVLPPSVVPSQSGIRIRGHNRSDDLFMYLKKKVTGLSPNTPYRISFQLQLASNVPTNAVGAGGAPGEAVTVKVGAHPLEPALYVDPNNYYRLNIDKGFQSNSGKDMIAVGHIGVSDTTTQYTLISRGNTVPLIATTNASGEIWLIVGTDSGFEGLTDLYYASIKVAAER